MLKDFLPNTRIEVLVMSLGCTVGAFVAAALGGFDQALFMLTVLVVTDYFTGFAASLKTGQASSQRGFIGARRKLMIYVVVAFAYVLDGAMQLNMLRSMVIFAYAANEGLSVMENIDRLGYGHFIPGFLRNKVEQLRSEKVGGGS